MPELMFDYETEAQRVVAALRKEFPHDTIDTDEGYNGRVHVKIVSRRFNGKNEREKQAYIGELLRDELGADAQSVSLTMVYGTDEL